jgi:acyl-CoA reductase-like NAD-dependent aldehyde dehydrogenase
MNSAAVIAHCALGEAADIDRAVAAARRAFEDGEWSRMKPVDRERLLHRMADLIESRADESMAAGFPKGVLNVVTGMGPTAGAALSGDGARHRLAERRRCEVSSFEPDQYGM